MTDFLVDFTQLEAAVELLEQIAAGERVDVVEPALEAAGERALEATLDMYPTRAAPKWADIGWPVSVKQRYWGFYAARAGVFDQPYRRTGELGKSITYKVTTNEDAWLVDVGTNWIGASWVIGSEEDQSPMHKGRWDPLEDRIKAAEDDIARTFAGVLAEEVTRAVNAAD